LTSWGDKASRTRQNNLRVLIESFGDFFESDRIDDLISYIDYGEEGLAIKMLCDWIYEENIALDVDQEAAILACLNEYGVDTSYFAFIGQSPPYPDLRTPEQIVELERASQPMMENVEKFARTGEKLSAVKMYRQITGADLKEAVAFVESISSSN
jgi:hypothetical protein